MLDRISRCRRMIFDKTGTLTYGKSALTDIMCAPRDSRPRRRFV
jgi:Cation transport ATPase